MRRIKNICVIMLAVVMVLFASIPVSASENNSIDEIVYTVYDKDGNFVEEGVLPKNSNARYNWGSITLTNGSTATFKQSGGKAFLASKGAALRFSYTLNKSATIQYKYMKCSSATATGSAWKTGTITASSGVVSKNADATTYYYVRVTNMSSDSIKITSASLNF